MSRESASDRILRGHSPEVRALAERLRRLVHDAVPVAEERAYPGWHGLGFHHPASGYFCAIFPLECSVRIGFEHGSELPDPRRLLTEGGRQVRYVEIRPGERIPVTGLRELMRRAIGRVRSRG